MKWLALLLVFCVSFCAKPVHAQNLTLQVVVWYDPDGDGQQEGVKQGTVVNVRETSDAQGLIESTDRFASAFFSVHPGLYRISAFPRSTRFLYEWHCFETVFVSETNDVVNLVCEERFFMRLPWTLN